MEMRAAIIDKFGDENELKEKLIPIPSPEKKQVLIKIEYAGVGSWDVFERNGGYAGMSGLSSTFPYVLGSEGCGVVVKIGEDVSRFKPGDIVAAAGFLNPKGGFYAEYVAVEEKYVTTIPSFYNTREASVILGVGITTLRGLVYTLGIKKNERVCILGASGGIGHLAVQIACGLGSQVYAIASGKDGIELINQYGIKKICDGYAANIQSIFDEMDFQCFDKALILGSSKIGDEICQRTNSEGIVAYPSGVYPEPTKHNNIRKYNGEPDESIIHHLNRMIEKYKIKPYISRDFSLNDAASAHRFISGHHIGKAVLKIN